VITYRRDIDGLRAVAVLLVIFYHAGFEFISGGFIGVDIFFVISGFLITSIINKKITEHHFSFADFYLKRIRRIYPLLLFVIFTTYIFASLILLPKEFTQLVHSGGLAFLSVGNFYFNNITGGYFDSSADIMPLLHTWSLAVEEQFYLIWPVLLIALYKLGKKEHIKWYALTLTLALIPLSQYLAINSPNSSYYLIPARGFELLMGATLALFWEKLPALSRTVNHWLSCIALLGLLYFGVGLEKGELFPGFSAAWVCLCTCLLVYTGKNHHHLGLANKLLALKPIVFLGLISYSLYLWHWPIIAFCNYLLIEKTLLIQALILLSTLALSIFSYFVIESQFRFKYRFSFKKTSFYFLAVPFIFLLLLSGLTSTTKGLPQRFPADIQKMLIAAGSGYYTPCKSDNCDKTYFDRLKSGVDKADFLLLGDSHARAVQGFVNSIANNADKDGSVFYRNGTPLTFDSNAYEYYAGDQKGIFSDTFTLNIKQLKTAIDEFKGDTVIISNRYALYTHGRNEQSTLSNIMVGTAQSKTVATNQAEANYLNGLKSSIDYILSKKKKIIIMSPLPELGKNLSKCSILKSYTPLDRKCDIDSSTITTRTRKIDMYINKLAESSPKIQVVDLKQYLCNGTKCVTSLDSLPLYHDDNHLNYLGSKYLGELYLNDHANFLKGDTL